MMGLERLLSLLFSLVGARVAGALAMLLAQLVLARTLPTEDVG
jgi:hypothetical protein